MPVRMYPKEYFAETNLKVVSLLIGGIIIGVIITLIGIGIGTYIRGKKCQ